MPTARAPACETAAHPLPMGSLQAWFQPGQPVGQVVLTPGATVTRHQTRLLKAAALSSDSSGGQSPKSQCQQGGAPSQGSREGSSRPLPALSATDRLRCPHADGRASPVSACILRGPPPPAPVHLCVFASSKDTSHWSRAHPTPSQLHLHSLMSAKTLLTNEVPL